MAELVDVDIPYAIEMSVVTEAQVPVLGKRTIVTRSYSQVTFARDPEGAWSQTFVPCAMENDSGQVTFPPNFIRSIPPRTHAISWTEGLYHVDTRVSFLGVQGPIDKIPYEADDPSIVDADDDGHPGVTVHLTLPMLGRVQLYLAQANHSVLTGELQDDGSIRGSIAMRRMETRTLAASIGLFAVNPRVTLVEGASKFAIVPDPDRRCRGAFPSDAPG